MCFCTIILDWTVFGLIPLDTILTLCLFCLYITPVITLSVSLVGFSIDLLCELIDWSLCALDALIEVYRSDLIYVQVILFIYLFALCHICFCLLILLILLFVFVDFVVAYLFFNSFHCSCSGFSIYFTFLSAISTLLFV